MVGKPLMNDFQLSQTAGRAKTRSPGLLLKPTQIVLSIYDVLWFVFPFSVIRLPRQPLVLVHICPGDHFFIFLPGAAQFGSVVAMKQRQPGLELGKADPDQNVHGNENSRIADRFRQQWDGDGKLECNVLETSRHPGQGEGNRP